MVLVSVRTSPSLDSSRTRPDGDRGAGAMHVRGDHLLLRLPLSAIIEAVLVLCIKSLGTKI